MKLRDPLPFVFALCVLTLAACDDSARSARSAEDARVDAREVTNFDRTGSFDLTNDRASSIRQRADDAFAALSGRPSRSRSRIGPQPWPEDLPSRWPRPDRARVLADTVRNAGDRLLLIDVPGTPEHALEEYRIALRDRGYEVDQPRTRRIRHALHAQSGDDEAVLTFFAREEVTRVEILFLGRASG